MKFRYVEGMIENVDYVECPICHKRVRMITEKHTKLVHNLTKEEFKNKYPNQSLCCSDRRDLTSQKTKEQWKDEDITSRRIQSLRENGKSDSFKKKVSDNSKKMWKREGFKEVQSVKIQNGLLNSPIFSKKQSEMMCAFWGIDSNRVERAKSIKVGISNSDTFSKIHSEVLKREWSIPEKRDARIKNIKNALSLDTEKQRRSIYSKLYWSRQSSKLAQSMKIKAKWSTKEYAENVSKGYYRCKYVSSLGKIYYLKSSYELRVCRFLDKNNIDFEYEFKGFDYVYDNSRHTYYPDFYLKDYGLVLEVKPEKFITDDLVLAKFNVVKDLGYNIIFITEDEVFSESNFLDTIQTSTTILKQ